jgi:Bacterial PH domain
MPGPTPDRAGADPVWRFRPRVLPMIATVMALCLLAVFTVVWSRLATRSEFTAFQVVTLLLFGGVMLWILYRMATLRIAAYEDRVEVRNVFRSYRLEWNRVQALRFSPGDPWLQLFDAEGNRIGVLAIQSADGARAGVAARELAEVGRDRGAGHGAGDGTGD